MRDPSTEPGTEKSHGVDEVQISHPQESSAPPLPEETSRSTEQHRACNQVIDSASQKESQPNWGAPHHGNRVPTSNPHRQRPPKPSMRVPRKAQLQGRGREVEDNP
ncbi:hypothetical protein Nepgr_026674 [Nepenthes gracilis]|uniref:Uncharacterized protein n=1 Tax=Nepenthes gracilis TaxID=150966 RepID=A0AAD3TA67_NEPGR|nr:hypothetical protein Nepgr_026674 [Nepenthes gracilis]